MSGIKLSRNILHFSFIFIHGMLAISKLRKANDFHKTCEFLDMKKCCQMLAKLKW
jgi:hypothetical protein